jgi:hypothetical protein
MAQIRTVRAQDSWATNREKLDFAEGIALLDPNVNPVTLMTMKFNKKKTGNIKHSWFTDELVAETDTVDTTTTACVTAGTALAVDHYDRWAVGDIMMREKTRETMLVTAINSTTGVTVVRDYGATSGAYTALAGSILDGEVMIKVGNAFEQGSPIPTILSTTEVQMDNYCQDVKTPFGISEVAWAAAVRGEDDWPYQMKKAGITHQRKLEYMNIWGHPMPGDKGIYVSATGNTAPAAAGGLWHFLTGGTGFSGTGSDRRVSQAEITKAEFLTWVQHSFRYGSSNRVLFAPPLLRTALDSWGIADLQLRPGDEVYGLAVKRWISSHGVITIVTHKMLEQPTGGSAGATAFMLDMEDLSWVTYNKIGDTRLRELDPHSSDGSTIKEAYYQTIGCIEVKRPEKHGILYGMTSFAA